MEERGERGGEERADGRTEPPALPGDFFASLLNLPVCKTEGRCNNCGRCER